MGFQKGHAKKGGRWSDAKTVTKLKPVGPALVKSLASSSLFCAPLVEEGEPGKIWLDQRRPAHRWVKRLRNWTHGSECSRMDNAHL
jgi:hypothetical protein